MIWITNRFQTWPGGIRTSLYSLQSSSVDASSYTDEPSGVLSRQVAGGQNAVVVMLNLGFYGDRGLWDFLGCTLW